MKTSFLKLTAKLASIFSFLFISFVATNTLAQRPRNIPDPEDSEPLALDSVPKILIYIGLPVLFFLLFLWLRRNKTKNKN